MYKKIFVILIGSFLLIGLNQKYSYGQHSKHCDKEKVIKGEDVTAEKSKKVENVGNKICPVMNEKINDKFKVTCEYKGKIYNLCCKSCVEKFKKNPEKCIKKVEEEIKSQKGQGTKEEHMHKGH